MRADTFVRAPLPVAFALALAALLSGPAAEAGGTHYYGKHLAGTSGVGDRIVSINVQFPATAPADAQVEATLTDPSESSAGTRISTSFLFHRDPVAFGLLFGDVEVEVSCPLHLRTRTGLRCSITSTIGSADILLDQTPPPKPPPKPPAKPE